MSPPAPEKAPTQIKGFGVGVAAIVVLALVVAKQAFTEMSKRREVSLWLSLKNESGRGRGKEREIKRKRMRARSFHSFHSYPFHLPLIASF